jgi:hypothetical protein
MPKPQVFVSYSRKDLDALEQLRDFLRPLERDGLIDAWTDQRIEGGEDWEREIEEALDRSTVAVLLISQRFLASDFIAGREIPKLLERATASQLTILPVYLSPSSVAETDFEISEEAGRRKIRLTKFQGFGMPDKPLSDLSWSDREREYGRLAQRIRALAGGTTASSARTPSKPGTLSGRTAAPAGEPSHAYELTIHLTRSGDSLGVVYHLPGTEPLSSVTVPWGKYREPLMATAQMLDVAAKRPLLRWLSDRSLQEGERLFELLFGDEERWAKIFRALFGTPPNTAQPTPLRAPVRLRIATTESLLAGLPWRLTAWKQRPLVSAGWTFETTSIVDPVDDHTLSSPSNILVLAPQAQADGAVPDPVHPEALRDLLAKVWPTGRDPGYLRVVRTREQLVHALAGMRPAILYVHACGVEAGGTPALLLDGSQREDSLPLENLPHIFGEAGHRPVVLVLHTTGLSCPVDKPLPSLWNGAIPLVVWRRLPEWMDDSSSWLLAWLGRWLGQGGDPVESLHAATREALRSSPDAATLAVHASYRNWKTSTYRAILGKKVPHLRLDRDHQKALVRKHLEELVRSDSRRVMALVTYAARGNALSSLWEQLRDYLELTLDHLAEINWLHFQFPIDRSRLRRDLEEELKLQLRADANERVEHLLRRHAPRIAGRGKRPILWLDWGTFGPTPALQPPLNTEQLGEWLRFTSEFLGAHCPDDLRVVSFVALESEAANHARLSQALQEHRRQAWARRPVFRLSELPPLGNVAEADLLEFLEDPANSSCDAGIQSEAAQLVIAQTGGDFEKTVQLLAEAEKGSWYDLLIRLRREQGMEPFGVDEPF